MHELGKLVSALNNLEHDLAESRDKTDRLLTAVREKRHELAEHPDTPKEAGNRSIVVFLPPSYGPGKWAFLLGPGGRITQLEVRG